MFVLSLWETGTVYARDPNPYLKRSLYIYWATKVIELSDTVFMLLRHKFRQAVNGTKEKSKFGQDAIFGKIVAVIIWFSVLFSVSDFSRLNFGLK